MRIREFCGRAAFGMGLTASLALTSLVGCGDKKAEDDAVAVAAPGETTTPGGSASTGSAAKPEAGKPADKETAVEPVANVKAEGWGTLKGKIVFEGTAPEVKILVNKGDQSAKDAAVCAAQAIPSQRFVVDPKTKGVKYAIISIPKPTAVNPEALSAAKSAKPVFDQKNCTFEPHVLAVLANSVVDVASKDSVSHNVNSKVPNNAFNFSLTAGSKKDTTTSPTRAPGKIVCDIHPWMSAYWYVSESPYFVVTGEDGSFEIKNVPAGTQKVVVWQEATGLLTPTSGVPVTIKADGVTEQTFTIPLDKIKPE